MSWKDNIQQDFTIQTGDNEIYTVFSVNASKNISWNGETFSFIGIRGQLVRKEEQMARQFPLEFYFQGADHLETSQRFENSLNSKLPCVIRHPLYGNIICHILSVTFGNPNDGLNATKITCTAIETILDGPVSSPSPVQTIFLKQAEISTGAPLELQEAVPVALDGVSINTNNAEAKKDALKLFTLPDEAKQYINAFNEATTFVNAITSAPIAAMASVCNLISIPAYFNAAVQDRVKFFQKQLDRMIATVLGRTVGAVSKKIFEIQACTTVSAMCVAAVTPVGSEYRTARSVVDVMNQLSNSFTQVQQVLDGLQVSTGGADDYYAPSADVFELLQDCVSVTIANLILIALNGKQERFVYTTENTNAILLSHKYYGSDVDDINLQYFIDTNNLKYQQLIRIKKGTKIVYYF